MFFYLKVLGIYIINGVNDNAIVVYYVFSYVSHVRTRGNMLLFVHTLYIYMFKLSWSMFNNIIMNL